MTLGKCILLLGIVCLAASILMLLVFLVSGRRKKEKLEKYLKEQYEVQ